MPRMVGPNFSFIIAPPNFTFPDREARLWVPTSVAPPGRVMMSDAIARLQPGATASQAAAEGTAIARAQIPPPFLDAILGKGGPVEVKVQTLVDDMTEGVRPALLLFLVGVGCLLLIACANVANLLLSRGISRWREVAVRAALGAGRARLIRQLLTESVVMASIGGAVGVVAALALVRTIPAIAPQDFPRLDAIRLDWNAVLFAFVVSLCDSSYNGHGIDEQRMRASRRVASIHRAGPPSAAGCILLRGVA